MAKYEVEYYCRPSGTCPVKEFLEELPLKARAKCTAYIDQFSEHGFDLPRSIWAKVTESVWELRPEYAGIEYRILFTIISPRAIMVHAVTKKKKKLLGKDIELAQRRARELEENNAVAERDNAP